VFIVGYFGRGCAGAVLPIRGASSKTLVQLIGGKQDSRVYKEFVDRGASARSAARPELKKMLEYIKENKDRVDYVIVHKVDRLTDHLPICTKPLSMCQY